MQAGTPHLDFKHVSHLHCLFHLHGLCSACRLPINFVDCYQFCRLPINLCCLVAAAVWFLPGTIWCGVCVCSCSVLAVDHVRACQVVFGRVPYDKTAPLHTASLHTTSLPHSTLPHSLATPIIPPLSHCLGLTISHYLTPMIHCSVSALTISQFRSHCLGLTDDLCHSHCLTLAAPPSRRMGWRAGRECCRHGSCEED